MLVCVVLLIIVLLRILGESMDGITDLLMTGGRCVVDNVVC